MEESELELSLGLSIGGSFRKVQKPAKSTPSLSTYGDAHFDPEERKREIHALRRQEAKRKREDKKKRGRTVVGSVDYDNNNNGSNDNESDGGFEAVMKKRLCGNQEEILGSGIQMQVTSSVPALPVQFGQFPNTHFVNYGNGFVFPYHMLPCWGPVRATGEEKNEKNVYYPVACRPLEALPVERENGGEVKSGESSEAAGSSSSAVSESRNGMSSSRETSHSVESKSLKRNAEAQSDHRATDDASQGVEEQKNAPKNNTSSPKTNTNANKPMENLIQRKAEEEEEESNPVHKPPPPPPVLPLMKKSNGGGGGGGGESNKPPRPRSKLSLLRSQSLPPMPCVSTTGDGPNGKKINGFLYKYNKTEVSIMCVCHGTSFTPAEFVKHAGGTDVSHPLKHIVVVPSAF